MTAFPLLEVPATEDRVSSHALEEMQYITDRGGESTVRTWLLVGNAIIVFASKLAALIFGMVLFYF